MAIDIHNMLAEAMLELCTEKPLASIQTAVEWIMSSDPEPPEVMARRITLIRKISLSDTLFGKDCKIYDIEE